MIATASPDAIVTGDDVRARWWVLNGLIHALAIADRESHTKEGRSALYGTITALREQADSFSDLVEAAADGTAL